MYQTCLNIYQKYIYLQYSEIHNINIYIYIWWIHICVVNIHMPANLWNCVVNVTPVTKPPQYTEIGKHIVKYLLFIMIFNFDFAYFWWWFNLFRQLIALDAHMFSHIGYGLETEAQELGPPGPGLQLLGPWSRAYIQVAKCNKNVPKCTAHVLKMYTKYIKMYQTCLNIYQKYIPTILRNT